MSWGACRRTSASCSQRKSASIDEGDQRSSRIARMVDARERRARLKPLTDLGSLNPRQIFDDGALAALRLAQQQAHRHRRLEPQLFEVLVKLLLGMSARQQL